MPRPPAAAALTLLLRRQRAISISKKTSLPAGQGTITAPGCIAATPIEAPLDITEGCSALDMPLVYFFGHTTPTDNPELYKVGTRWHKVAPASPLP